MRTVGGVLFCGSHTTHNPPQSLSCDSQLSSNISNPREESRRMDQWVSLGLCECVRKKREVCVCACVCYGCDSTALKTAEEHEI